MRQVVPRGQEDWECYDLENDPTEMHDMSAKEPDVMKRLVEH